MNLCKMNLCKMNQNKIQLLATVILLLGMVCISGCSKKETTVKNEITVATNSESGSLDPSGMIAITYLDYSVSALDELVTFDEKGDIVYRGATSYEVNENATIWTFHLREKAVWSDGTPVVAEDYLNTITRALDPSSQNGYSNYLFPIQNAEAIYHGEKPMEELGVQAVDAHTLKFTLYEPCYYFLKLLRLPVYTPSCVKYADAVGSGWDKNPKTSVSNGPFYLYEYVPEQYFVLKKNPLYWDAKHISLDKITYQFFSDQQSMANAYETGEVDVATGLQASVMEQYKGQPDLRMTNLIATRYIYPNLKVKPLDDVRVRKAINLGINRKELCKVVGQNTTPTVNFVAMYMQDAKAETYFIDGAKKPFEEDLEEAKRLLAEAGYPNGEGFKPLTYYYPSLEMDSDTAQVLQAQLKKNLGIEMKLQAQELQVNYTQRRSGDFDLCRMNWTADFADPYTYLSMLLSNSTYNCSGVKDEAYDTVMKASDLESDPVKRGELLHQAEQQAVGQEAYIIPLFGMKNCNLIRPEIKNVTQIEASGALEYRYAKK
ncbi:MAG: peptide ABC transporter substrate-binding protein [Lachnospiraceae bacterium]